MKLNRGLNLRFWHCCMPNTISIYVFIALSGLWYYIVFNSSFKVIPEIYLNAPEPSSAKNNKLLSIPLPSVLNFETGIQCIDKSSDPKFEMRGTNYWALYNYLPADEVIQTILVCV